MSAVTLNRVSKIVLVASSFLTAYAILAIAMTHIHHHGPHHGPHHHHEGGAQMVPHGEPERDGAPHRPHHHSRRMESPSISASESAVEGPHHEGDHHHKHHHRCPLKLLAYIALVTGLTGICAGFKPRSRKVVVYIVGLFLFEIVAVLIVLGGEVRAVRWCQTAATVTPVRLQVAQATINNVNVLVAQETIGTPIKDEVFAHECSRHVVHVATVSTLVIGVVIGALVGCASRLLRETRQFEASAGQVVVAVPLQQQTVAGCVVEDDEKASLKNNAEVVAA